MEQIRRREAEISQFNKICFMIQDFPDIDHSRRSLRDADLEPLGIVRSSRLEVDDLSPIDFEHRLFRPNSCEELDLKDAAEYWKCSWHRPGYLDEPKELGRFGTPPIPPHAIEYPEAKCKWFLRASNTMILRSEDPDPYNWFGCDDQRELGFFMIDFDCWDPEHLRREYRMVTAGFSREDTKPHSMMIMVDSLVGEEDTLLASELEAALTLAKRQVRFGAFTNHHTKPVMVVTFMYETHARITQGYFDAKLDKFVIRQSRLLNIAGDEPTPDSFLLLRWMANDPVGDTEYPEDKTEGPEDISGGPRRVSGQRGLVTA